MLTTRHGVRPLGAADLPAFLELARRDPVVNVFADYRASTTNLEPRWLGGEIQVSAFHPKKKAQHVQEGGI